MPRARVHYVQLDADFIEQTASIMGALLETSEQEAAWYAVKLWLFCIRDRREDGVFCGNSAALLIEAVSGWRGTPGRLVNVLSNEAVGLIDELDGGGLRVRGLSRYHKLMRKRASERASKGPVFPESEKEKEKEKENKDYSPASQSIPPSLDSSEAPTAVNIRAMGGADFQLEPTPVETPRKLSEQEQFAEYFAKQRASVTPIPDNPTTVAQLNKMLQFVTETQERIIAGAVREYLADERMRAWAPPCPLFMFARNWPKYATLAERRNAL